MAIDPNKLLKPQVRVAKPTKINPTQYIGRNRPAPLQKDYGFIEGLGQTLDRPGQFARNLLAGRPVDAVKALPGIAGGVVDLIPGISGAQQKIDSAVGFNDDSRMSGQRMLKNWGLLKDDKNPLLSAPGAAGIAAELATDPLAWVTGGATRAGTAAAKVSGAAKWQDELNLGLRLAQQRGDAAKVKQFSDLLRTVKPVTGPKLATGNAAQAAAGQRALVKLGGDIQLFPGLPTIRTPEITLIKGTGAYKAMDKLKGAAGKAVAGSPLARMFAHGPAQDAATKADRYIRAGESDFQAERQMLNRLRETTDAAERAQLVDQLAVGYQRWHPNAPAQVAQDYARSAEATFRPVAAAPGVDPLKVYAAQDKQLLEAIERGHGAPASAAGFVRGSRERNQAFTQLEQGLGIGNVGSAYRQLTPENKAVLAQFDKDPVVAQQVLNELNNRLAVRGAKPITLQPTINTMLDNAGKYGLRVDELNDALVAAGVSRKQGRIDKFLGRPHDPRLLTESPIDAMTMRGAQHMRSRSIQEYADEMQKAGAAKLVADPVHRFPAPLGKQTFYFKSAEEAGEAARTLEMLTEPKKVGPLLHYIDKITSAWKTGVTRPRAAFHFRNHISNTIQSWLEGVNPLGPHRDYARKLVKGEDFALQLPDGTTLTREQLNAEMRAAGASTEGQHFFDALGDPDPMGRPGAFEKVMGGLEKVAAVPANIAANRGRLSGAMSGGGSVEALDRASHYIAKRMQGFDPKTAAASTDKALFNYSAAGMTEFEQNTMKRVVPFYGFQRSILPFILDKVISEPGKLGALMRVGRQPQPENMPDYLRGKGAIGMPESMAGLLGGPVAQDRVIGGLPDPVEQAYEPFSRFEQGTQKGVEGMISQMSPLIKNPMEYGLQRDAFTGRPLNDKAPPWLQALGIDKVDTGLKAIGNITPLAGIASTANRLSEPTASLGTKAISTLFGFTAKKFDPKEQAIYNKMADARAGLKDYVDAGFLRYNEQYNQFTQADKTKRLPKEVVMALNNYKELAKDARNLREQKKRLAVRQSPK